MQDVFADRTAAKYGIPYVMNQIIATQIEKYPNSNPQAICSRLIGQETVQGPVLHVL